MAEGGSAPRNWPGAVVSLDGFGLAGVAPVQTWRVEGGAFRGWVLDHQGRLFEGPRCIQCGAMVVLKGSGQPGDRHLEVVHGGVPRVHWCNVASALGRALRSVLGLPRLPREPAYVSSPWGVPRYGSGWTPDGWVDHTGGRSAVPDHADMPDDEACDEADEEDPCEAPDDEADELKAPDDESGDAP